MKGKKLFLLSLVLALAAASAIYVYLNQMEEQSKTAANLVPVLVAKAEIPARVKLEASMFTTMEVSQTAIHGDAITDVTQLSGAFSRDRLMAGEQVLTSRLVFDQSETGLAFKISAGHRAVTVPVNNVSGVAGFILPGDFVDTIVTIDPPSGEDKQTLTSVVAGNIRVLAVGQYVYEQESEQLVVDTVTLDAPVDAVSAIIQASERGSLRLVLRPVSEASASVVQAHKITQFQ
ncbi:MAG: Flp pilus assembly protein CpaB [Firmicutes bacterium]|nr:Flp pilus assembly protein CpaB [Bacillota bacterium]